MKVLFLTNMPTPYRVDFCNCLSKYCQLTVIFEGKRTNRRKYNWIDESQFQFAYYFAAELRNEQKIRWSILYKSLRGRYDTIIIGCYHTYTQIILILLLKLLHKKYIFETDGGIIPVTENILKKKCKCLLMGNAATYLSPSTATDQYLMHYGVSADKISRYPFTSIREVDLAEHVPTPQQKLDLRKALGIDSAYLIITVGQFIHRKGFDILLRAMKDVRSNVMVCIVGGTPTDEYQSIVKELNLRNVVFIPFLSLKDLIQYYRAADLFVLPTREDIWGLVINEAMAQGLPVITTDKCIAGIELIADKDLIVGTENPAELSKAINSLLSSPQRMWKIAENNLQVMRKYTIESMANAIYEAIK